MYYAIKTYLQYHYPEKKSLDERFDMVSGVVIIAVDDWVGWHTACSVGCAFEAVHLLSQVMGIA